MSALSNRLAHLERAAGVNQPCPQCSISEPTPADAPPGDYIAGTCGFCGGPMNYYAKGWTRREREVGLAMASVHFGVRLRDERAAVMGCWLDRRLKERGRTVEQELERLRAKAAFDPAARVRLAGRERVEAEAAARWHAAVIEASDEALELAARIEEYSDEELVKVIWPPELSSAHLTAHAQANG